MKLLRVIATVDPATGGPVAGLRAITPPLEALGHTSEFLTVDSPIATFLPSWVGKVHAMGPVKNRYASSPKLRPWLERNIEKYDAVIVHGLWQDLGRTVRNVCRSRRSPPYLVFPHGMLDPQLRTTYPALHLKKWIYWQLVERRVLRDARAVLYTCEEERRLASSTFPRYQCREEVVTYGAAVPDGGSVSFVAAWQARCPAVFGRRFILFLGRVHSKKGVDLLIRAYAQVRREKAADPSFPDLVIAGPSLDSSYLASLRKIAEEAGVSDQIHWTGMLTGDAKWGALQSADTFILPSYQENFGIAVVEALACGKPVLISDRVNIWRELVGDRAALVEPATLHGTAQLLRRWLALGSSERDAMSQAASASFHERFEIGRSARSFAEQLEKLLKPQKQTATA